MLLVMEGKMVIVEQEGGYAVPFVQVDRVCLEESLENLLNTATPEGKYRITVERID